jgi:hypothetical protein
MSAGFDIDTNALSAFPEALKLLGLSPASDRLFNRRLATTGLLDCLPLAAVDAASQIVFRTMIDPGLAEPGIALADIVSGESMLIASGAATFVPIWIVTRLVHAKAAEWDAWAHLSAEQQRSLAGLHAHLGGEGSLDSVQRLLADQEIRAALCQDLDGELWSKHLPDAFEIAAPSDPRGQFQGKLREVLYGRWADGLDADPFGSWGPPLEKALGVLGRPSDPEQLYRLLVRAIRRPTAHDSGWCDGNGVGDMFGTAADERGAPILTARRLVANALFNPEEPQSAPIRALAEQGDSYDGRAHLDCVTVLMRDGDVGGAWQSALSACFWTYRRIGKVPAEMQLMMGRLAQDVSADRLWPVVSRNLEAMGATVR